MSHTLPTLIIETTQLCNLSCSYCFQRTQLKKSKNLQKVSHKSLNIEYARNAIYWMLNHFEESLPIQVIFFGGEPLLEWNLIREIYFEFKEDPVKFGIQTNGTLITRSIAEFIRKTRGKISLSISYDGIPIINDRYRIFPNGKGTSKIIIGKMEMLKANQVPFSVISVVSNEMAKYPKEVMLHLRDLEIKKVSFNPLHSVKHSISPSKYAEFLIDVYKFIMETKNFDIEVRELKAWFYNLFLGSPFLCGAGIKCPGGVNMFYVDINGDVWPCPKYKVNKVGERGIPNKVKNPKYPRICEKCPLFRYCGGGCPVFNSSWQCQFIKIFAPQFIALTIKNKEFAIEYFGGEKNR